MITDKEYAEIIEAYKREQPDYAAQLASIKPTTTNQDGPYGKYLPPRELTDKEKEILQKLDAIDFKLNRVQCGLDALLNRPHY